MLLRRATPVDPTARDRVLRLLGHGAVGGWVPPEEAQERHEAPEEEQEAPEPTDDLVERSWSAGRSAAAREAVPLRLDAASLPERSPATGLAGRPGALLPPTLRGGLLDPGHRGAVALLLVGVLAALVAAAVVLRGRPQEVAAPAVGAAVVEAPGAALPGAPSASPSPGDVVVVAVAGTVVRPGLVRLPAGSRVDDAVRAAGGLSPGGSYGLLNLARRLVDGEQVLVGVEPPPGSAPAAAARGGLVNLNTATAADFQALPGIGPVLAERVVEWRTENGPFASVDQLREVPGIGEAKYTALKSRVTV